MNGAETKMTVFKKARAARRLVAAGAIATAVGGGLGAGGGAGGGGPARRRLGPGDRENGGGPHRIDRAGRLRGQPARSADRARRSA